MLTRILLLFSISLIVKLKEPFFTLFETGLSGRDLILILGGLFLLAKSTMEIHSKLEGEEEHHNVKAKASFMSVIIQILLFDVVFSLDSVITAIGMANDLPVMIPAVVIAVILVISYFQDR